MLFILAMLNIKHVNKSHSEFLANQKEAHLEQISSLEELEKEIIQDIEDGNYDKAKIKLNQMRLTDGYSSEETVSWDDKREEYLNMIKDLQDK